MAYISHSPHRAYWTEARAHAVAPALWIKSALVAVAAAGVVVALSGASPTGQPIAVKGDRLAAAAPVSPAMNSGADEIAASVGADVRRDGNGRVVYVNDPVSGTTTVSRGASADLSPDSPLRSTAK
jgi:hypothetical protein